MDKIEFGEWYDNLNEKEQAIAQDYMYIFKACRKCGGDGRVTLFDETERCGYCDGYGADPDQEKTPSDYQIAIDAVIDRRPQDKINAECEEEDEDEDEEICMT